MSKASDYEAGTEKLLEPIVKEHDFELVDVEYVKEGSDYILRAYIDKPGGITIDDCEVISRALSDKLDAEDFIGEAYILEVSSPGLGRPLKKDKDFARHLEDDVEVRLYKPFPKDYEVAGLAGVKEFEGILKAFDEKSVTIEVDEGESCKVGRSEIALIRQAFDF